MYSYVCRIDKIDYACALNIAYRMPPVYISEEVVASDAIVLLNAGNAVDASKEGSEDSSDDEGTDDEEEKEEEEEEEMEVLISTSDSVLLKCVM